MKSTLYCLLILTALFGCNQTPKQFSENSSEATSKIEIVVKEGTVIKDLRDKYKFDNSIIPDNLIKFFKTMDAKLRIPSLSDYDDYYFTGYYDKKLPYFCTGNYNNDTILDFVLVLIKDTTEQLIYSFHSNKDSFIPYLISKSKLSVSENKKFKVVVFIIQTETDRSIEAIDTTYRIESDAIEISNMFESRTYTTVWDKKTDQYIDLLLD